MRRLPHVGFALATSLFAGGIAAAADVKVAPYGSWASPIKAENLAIAGERYSELAVDGDSLYWLEFVPAEGRAVVRRRGGDGAITTLTPAGFGARTRVHEYGGGAMTVADGVVYFTNARDQQLYRQAGDAAPEPLTSEQGTRYANCTADRSRSRLVCVREDHRGAGEAKNELVAVPMRPGAATTVLFSASDFVSDPAVSPDGSRLAFLSWMHPNMPWDRVTLRVADVKPDGRLGRVVAVNDGVDEAARSPQWGPDGALYFVGDRDDWWNFLRWKGGRVERVTRERLEFSFPAWDIGERSWGFLADGRIIALYNDRGAGGVGIVDPRRRTFTRLATEVVQAHSLAVVRQAAYFEAGFRDRPQALVELDVASGALAVVRRPDHAGFGAGFASAARAVEYPTGGGATAHAFYYAPANPGFRGPDGTHPPLIVVAHGGPTLNTTPAYNVSLQYWTSRGFAVLDLNYRGSTGFGRPYRRSLYGQFGVADIEDAVYGARWAAAQGLADRDKLIVRGGSAGGFIVLASLAFHDVFKAGANYFGVSDLGALAAETHKFESHYIDSLVGAPGPGRAGVFRRRSPIYHLEGFRTPLITLQGLKDEVVPPNQSERIVEALRAKGVPVAYLTFPDEAHGFRTLAANVRAREAELYFYGRVLGFTPADPLPPIQIDNLPPK